MSPLSFLPYLHRTGFRTNSMSFLFANSCVFSKQLPPPFPSFSLSFGFFAEFLHYDSSILLYSFSASYPALVGTVISFQIYLLTYSFRPINFPLTFGEKLLFFCYSCQHSLFNFLYINSHSYFISIDCHHYLSQPLSRFLPYTSSHFLYLSLLEL